MSNAKFAMLIGTAVAAFVINNHAPALAQEVVPPPAADSGVIRVKSGYDMDQTLARIKKDIATLDKIYSPDLTYSHSSALLQNKAEVLKAAAGKGITESETFHDSNIRIYGNVALVRGVTELRNGNPGDMHDNHLNILWVLVKGPGPNGWQIVARQTTRLPEKK